MLQRPKCHERRCRHFVGVKQSTPGDESTERVVCKAFPDGIPSEIAYGGHKHVRRYPGDHGIRFEEAT